VDEDELARVIRIEDRHQAIHHAVTLYSEAIVEHLRQGSEAGIDLWMAVVPEDVYRYCRPQSKVEKDERQRPDTLMNKAAATRLLQTPGLFDEDNVAAEVYLYELDFHNQLKARLLEHKVAVQVLRETTLAPEDFIKANGMPLRGLQDPATLAWNLATTCFFKAGGRPWQLGKARPGVCYVGIVFKKDFSSPEPGNACCGAQMFLESGDGVVFRGAVGPWMTEADDDFHLPRDKARALMQLVVDAYRKNHGGEAPKELFIHGKTRFDPEEWEGFRETVPADTNVVCLRHDLAGHAVFEGEVSLAQNGGFASVRSGPGERGRAGATACLVEVRGDTKQFKLSLLTDDGFDSVSYQASFAPDTHHWQTISLPISSFRASFRGRDLPDVPALNPARIRQVGLMIAGRQSGPFALDIRRIGLA
jgi:Complex I intermediate-associated protein 30 (CIA30)